MDVTSADVLADAFAKNNCVLDDTSSMTLPQHTDDQSYGTGVLSTRMLLQTTEVLRIYIYMYI